MWVVYDSEGTAGPQYWEEKLSMLFLLPGNRFVSLLKDTWMFRFLVENIPKGSLVLDLGCGSGFSSHVLKEYGLEIFGIDYSFPLVRRCSETHGSSNYICGDIRSLPFKSGSFDAVVSISSLEHVEVGLPRAIEEVRRVLKTNGIFIVIAPSPIWADEVLEKIRWRGQFHQTAKDIFTFSGEKKAIAEKRGHTRPRKGFHAYWMSLSEWSALCEKKGFSTQTFRRGDFVGGLIRSKIFGKKVLEYQKKLITQALTGPEDGKNSWTYDLLVRETPAFLPLRFLLRFLKVIYSYLNGMVYRKTT